MSLKKWIVKNNDISLAKEMAEECEVDSFTALLALNRGIDEAYLLDEFLSDESELGSPFALCDMDIAAERITAAIESFEKIAVFGDYDCDGVTATALLYSFLKSGGADVMYYIPNRLSEGYGMNEDAVRKLCAEGVKLIITVDNGINAVNEIELANELGMEVIVTDHHLPQTDLPNAVAVIDPHRSDDCSELSYLSGVGVAFKLICALSPMSTTQQLLEAYSEIVTLGLIGDIVPIIGENRTICKYGLDMINNSPSLGIEALRIACAADKKELNSSSVSFQLVPRINAAGRMGDSRIAVELLMSDNPDEARRLSEELERKNSERQAVGDGIFKEAIEKIEADALYKNRVIVVSGKNWHSGIVGIVAARIVEKYDRPVIVFSEQDGVLHGSGRSIEGFNLFMAISYASEATVTFGGHEQAAGVTLKAENLGEFRRLINEYANSVPKCYPAIYIDCKLRPEAIGVGLSHTISRLEPYGTGNQKPIFGLYGARIVRIEHLKSGKYIKIFVEKNGYSFPSLCFMYNASNFPFRVGDIIDLAFNLEINEFRGKQEVSLLAKQLRPHGIDEGLYFDSLSAYDDLLLGIADRESAELIIPQRDDFKAVFAFIRNSTAPVCEEKLLFRFHSMGAGKVKVILEAFSELQLIKYSSDENFTGYTVSPSEQKVALDSAEIIKELISYLESGGGVA